MVGTMRVYMPKTFDDEVLRRSPSECPDAFANQGYDMSQMHHALE